jgi:hypothetical protein
MFVEELKYLTEGKVILKMIFKDGVLVKTYPHFRKKRNTSLARLLKLS